MNTAQWVVASVYVLMFVAMVVELRKDLRNNWIAPWTVWFVGALCAALLTVAAWMFFLIASKP